VFTTTDLESFVAAHSTHGPLSGSVGRLSLNGGYRHRITCSCGATFHRFVTRAVTRRVDGPFRRDADLPPVASGDLALVDMASV
jgi:hypothetical protein